ncbi:hypothetical protein D3C76_1080870 [compost metagenome]
MLFLLIPAVSINIYFPNSLVKCESIASLVVPAISLTITLSSPSILLTSDDFPTLGLPIIATLTVSSSSISGSTLSNLLYISSNISPIPNFLPADIPNGSPNPRL